MNAGKLAIVFINFSLVVGIFVKGVFFFNFLSPLNFFSMIFIFFFFFMAVFLTLSFCTKLESSFTVLLYPQGDILHGINNWRETLRGQQRVAVNIELKPYACPFMMEVTLIIFGQRPSSTRCIIL